MIPSCRPGRQRRGDRVLVPHGDMLTRFHGELSVGSVLELIEGGFFPENQPFVLILPGPPGLSGMDRFVTGWRSFVKDRKSRRFTEGEGLSGSRSCCGHPIYLRTGCSRHGTRIDPSRDPVESCFGRTRTIRSPASGWMRKGPSSRGSIPTLSIRNQPLFFRPSGNALSFQGSIGDTVHHARRV